MKREELERIRALNAARTPGEVLAAAVEYIPGLTDKPMMGIGLLCADGKPTTKLIAITGEIGAEWEAQSAADAYYLEAAWNGVPAILRHIDEQDARTSRAREALERIGEVKSVHFTESCDCGWCQCVRMARAALKEAQDG